MDTAMKMGPLYNIPAEQEVLGAILLNNDNMCDIDLNWEDFYLPRHQELYKAMQYLFSKEKGIDITTIGEFFKSDLKSIGGYTYLTQLASCCAIFERTKVEIVKEKANARRLCSTLKIAVEDIESRSREFNEVYNDVQNKIYDITIDSKHVLENDTRMMEKTLNTIEKNYKVRGELIGYGCGIKEIDRALNGFQKGKLYVIAGRPSMGKSTLALNICQGISRDKWVLYYSLEMSTDELGLRRLSMLSSIDGVKIERGIMTDDEWNKIVKNASLISSCKMITNDSPGININTIIRQAKKLKLQGKLHMIIVDHIGIMDKDGMGSTLREQITNICIKLKNIAKKFDVPVIALSQISRAAESRSEKKPLLSDLKESSGIEENADAVMLLYREEYYNPKTSEKNIIEVNIAKQRGGRTGTIKLKWLPKYQRIDSMFNCSRDA